MRTSRQPAKRQGTKQKATKTLSATFSSVSSCIPPYKNRPPYPEQSEQRPNDEACLLSIQFTLRPQTPLKRILCFYLFPVYFSKLFRPIFFRPSAPVCIPWFLTDKGPGFRTFSITDKSPISPGWALSQKQSSFKYLQIFIRRLSNVSLHTMLNNVLILSSAGINKENCYK